MFVRDIFFSICLPSFFLTDLKVVRVFLQPGCIQNAGRKCRGFFAARMQSNSRSNHRGVLHLFQIHLLSYLYFEVQKRWCHETGLTRLSWLFEGGGLNESDEFNFNMRLMHPSQQKLGSPPGHLVGHETSNQKYPVPVFGSGYVEI